MSIDPKVLAICVNWNGKEVLPETLASLIDNDYPHLDILVVDNASTDGSLKTVSPPVKTLALPKNLGYGGALNAAIRPFLFPGGVRQGELPLGYFLLLNNDLVVEPDCVSQLIRFSQEKGPWIYGPKILRYDQPQRLDAAWGRLNWSHVLARYYGKGAPEGPHWSQPRRVDLLTGCALLVHRRVFEEVGLWDENFFMYHEEVDFLYRAAQKGYPVYYCPFTRVRHRGAHATHHLPLQRVFWIRRNTVYFLKKHRPGLSRWAYFWLTLSASLLYNLVSCRWKRTAVICRGVVHGFKLAKSLERPETTNG